MIRNLSTALHRRFRRFRYETIHALIKLSERPPGFVLDLGGGSASFFAALYPHPEEIILLEVEYALACKAKARLPTLNVIVADGQKLPFARQSLSMTVCNSVIEHVDDPGQLASEIQRVSRCFFVQTPNGRFPVETYSFITIPFYNQLPGTTLKRLLCALFGGNFDYISSVRYLSETRLNQLFPQATIHYEKSLGLKKSFYLVQKNEEHL
jgi:ubiquinone/menaquinone biosynthesis C-methylase UbiE